MLEGYRYVRSTADFDKWYSTVTDKVAKKAVNRRIARIAAGLLGDVKRIGKISEVRIHIGPGYRIYFAQQGDVLVVLLAGGDKSTQDRDIERAQEMLRQLEGEGTWLI